MGSIAAIFILLFLLLALYVANCIARTSINTKKISEQNEQIIQLLRELTEK